MNDYRQRRDFSEWTLELLAIDTLLYANKKKLSILERNQSTWDLKASNASRKYLGLVEIGQHFFEYNFCQAITTNYDQFFWTEFEDLETNDMWMQQDGTRYHTVLDPMDLIA